MQITFEGQTLKNIFNQMAEVLAEHKNISDGVSEDAKATALPSAEPQGPGPDEDPFGLGAVDKAEDKPEDKPGDKPVDPRIAKMQAAKAAKKAAREAEEEKPKAAPPKKAEAKALSPAEIVEIRTKTIADLQDAYANGHQKEVFELLSRFGNGAKSFRELSADAFVPIREANDNGALT